MTIKINLKTDTNDLREIYFQGNRHKYFFGPDTKRQSMYLVFTIVVFPFFVAYALPAKNDWYFIIGCMFFSYLIYDFWKAAMPIIRWKKSILNFLEKAEKIEVLKLAYTDDFFIHTQNNEVVKQQWKIIDRAIVNDRFIWLLSSKNILLPKSSMSQ